MAVKYHILHWRDIPSMVKAKIGRTRLSAPLSNRFMEAIDMAAMRDDETDTDAYLKHWQASESYEIEGDPQAYIDAVAARLEDEFPKDKLIAMAKNGGITV